MWHKPYPLHVHCSRGAHSYACNLMCHSWAASAPLPIAVACRKNPFLHPDARLKNDVFTSLCIYTILVRQKCLSIKHSKVGEQMIWLNVPGSFWAFVNKNIYTRYWHAVRRDGPHNMWWADLKSQQTFWVLPNSYATATGALLERPEIIFRGVANIQFLSFVQRLI